MDIVNGLFFTFIVFIIFIAIRAVELITGAIIFIFIFIIVAVCVTSILKNIDGKYRLPVVLIAGGLLVAAIFGIGKITETNRIDDPEYTRVFVYMVPQATLWQGYDEDYMLQKNDYVVMISYHDGIDVELHGSLEEPHASYKAHASSSYALHGKVGDIASEYGLLPVAQVTLKEYERLEEQKWRGHWSTLSMSEIKSDVAAIRKKN